MKRTAQQHSPAHAGAANPAAAEVTSGTVIASHGRHYVVAPAEGGPPLQCFPRGKKSEIAVGDIVEYKIESNDQAVIVEIRARRNLLFRSDQYKSKLFAANLDQLLIVVATEPHFSEDLLGRALVASDLYGLAPLIVLNKVDVGGQPLLAARERLRLYTSLGYEVLEASASRAPQQAIDIIGARLSGRATLLLGQSGMGKSTLVNLLVPGAEATTREISSALHSGKHTTTFTRLYTLPQGGAVIDSPGFQEFGLYHLSQTELAHAFTEFRPLLGKCRFYNCLHLHEPGCAILAAVAEGQIAPRRHALYAQLVHESQQTVR